MQQSSQDLSVHLKAWGDNLYQFVVGFNPERWISLGTQNNNESLGEKEVKKDITNTEYLQKEISFSET